ncbi:MAG TPA: cytochrome c maturation protein CcmE [Candidatus Binatia bacterium]|jgi:cytochrome c-type biogenesis protein CcmE
MKKNKRILIGGLIILGTLTYIIYGGAKEALVYFYTPSELQAKARTSTDKFLRMGGMVVQGSLKKDVKNLTYDFQLTDGSTTVPVTFKGVPPDLFADGKGAVVEGRLASDGVFHATTIMAKHSEEYKPPADSNVPYPHTFIPAKESAQK